MFQIATGHTPSDAVTPKSAGLDGMGVSFGNDSTRAERTHRQIIENIETFETPEELDAYMAGESLIIDALYLSFPHYADRIIAVADEWSAALRPDAPTFADSPQAGAPETAQAKGTKKMFVIDTGASEGSQGPFMSWTSEGSARKGLKPESWVLRSKDEGGSWISTAIPAFVNGCVMDLDSLKLGWEKDGGQGVAPERRWNPSVSQQTPRPSDEKKASGAFVWSRALSIRCAIGGGQAATWEQAAFGAYEAFDRLAKQIMAEWADHSQNGVLLPLVKQTSIERRRMNNGSSSVPVLEIVKWVPRPDCLKADAPQIATSAPPTPAPQPAPQPAPAPAASIPADAEF